MFASLTECSGLSQSGGHLVLWYMSFLVISFLCFLESCLSAHLWTMAFSHLSWGEHIEGFTDLRNLVLADSPHPLARSALPLAHYITSMSWVLFQGATFSLTSGPLHMLIFFLLGILFPYSCLLSLTLQVLAQKSLSWETSPTFLTLGLCLYYVCHNKTLTLISPEFNTVLITWNALTFAVE